MRFRDLTRDQLRVLSKEAVVVLPVGACEQHGPHLPVGTDSMLVEHIAEAAAVQVKEVPVLVAPPVPFGSSAHHLAYGGTISVSSETLQRYLAECCDSLVQSGFRRLFILNGHGGNIDVIGDVARDASIRHAVAVGSGSYWTMAWEELVSLGAHEMGLLPGHAGAFETAMASQVHSGDQLPSPPARPSTRTSDPRSFHPPFRVDDQRVWQDNDGYTDNPAAAGPQDGALYLSAVVRAVSRAFLEFHSRTS
jgi:creatinine amidohydrolase